MLNGLLHARRWTIDIIRALRIYGETPGRTLIAVAALALGVGMGLAVHLINRAALNEFTAGLRTLSGTADLTVRGSRTGFPVEIYLKLAQRPDVAVASPMVEIEVRVIGQRELLTVLGVDVFRAALLQPSLVGQATSEEPLAMLRPDAIFLSPSIISRFSWRDGTKLRVQVGTDVVELTVAGRLPLDTDRPPVAVMDIAGAQALAGGTAAIHRIDLRLRPGVDAATARAEIARDLPLGVVIESTDEAGVAEARLSRAYRVNLTVLALVALFTGALLVFSTEALAIVRRRAEIALLRALGLTRVELLTRLLGEAAVMGIAGGVVGVLLGYAVAALVLHWFGADLGAGFFAGVQPTLVFAPLATLAFLALGIVAAMAGALIPGLEAARAPPAQALRAGDVDAAWARLPRALPGLVLFALAAGAALLPPIAALPLGGYASVAALLLGTIALMPRVAHLVLRWLPILRSPPLALAVQQMRGSPGQPAISLGAIVAAVSLAVSMAIMVHSFRGSLDAWLIKLLPAELYLRSGGGSDSAFFTLRDQSALAALPGIARIEFLRFDEIVLDPDRPRVTLLARDIDPSDPGARLPLVHSAPLGADLAPVWVSEAIVESYGYGLGHRFDLPVGNARVPVTVAGVWRDYGRQQGAIVFERARFSAASGDARANDAGVWLKPGTDVGQLRTRIARIAPALDITTPGEIRTRSLAVFDRTFAVTYALEAAAILIGLAGLAASFSGLVLARRREFGMLRHIGFTRADVARMLALQGGLIAALAAGAGLVAGGVMSLVLVYVINRQAFGWTMDIAIPVLGLAGFCVAMIALAILTAVASGRAAMRPDVVRTVKEDW